MDKNAKKIVIVVVLLAIAGVVTAWQMGLFGGKSSTPTAPVTEDVKGPTPQR
ncbi:MAG TPA: hypothetical protein VG797_10625 [Phycisphaerales bacterium]|nr:hypothetical protein [Phycisphaerales bacterium]